MLNNKELWLFGIDVFPFAYVNLFDETLEQGHGIAFCVFRSAVVVQVFRVKEFQIKISGDLGDEQETGFNYNA